MFELTFKNYVFHQQWMEAANEPHQREVVKELLGARDAMLGIRYHMRKMGEAAGIPVSSLPLERKLISFFVPLFSPPHYLPTKNAHPCASMNQPKFILDFAIAN